MLLLTQKHGKEKDSFVNCEQDTVQIMSDSRLFK